MSQAFDNFVFLSSKQKRFILNDECLLADLIKTNMSERRFEHSLLCAKLAKELASYHHIDQKKAYIAGLLHDVTKELPIEEQDDFLRYYDLDKLVYPDKVKHSFSAKYYLKEKLHYHDKDVLNAIYNHTICNSNDSLSMILYIADKREESRHINDDVVSIARYDLKKAKNMLIDIFAKMSKD